MVPRNHTAVRWLMPVFLLSQEGLAASQVHAQPTPTQRADQQTAAQLLTEFQAETGPATRWQLARYLQAIDPWGLPDSRVFLDVNFDAQPDFCRAVFSDWLDRPESGWGSRFWVPKLSVPPKESEPRIPAAESNATSAGQESATNRQFVLVYLCSLSSQPPKASVYDGEVTMAVALDDSPPDQVFWHSDEQLELSLLCRQFFSSEMRRSRCTHVTLDGTSRNLEIGRTFESTSPTSAESDVWVDRNSDRWPDHCWIEPSPATFDQIELRGLGREPEGFPTQQQAAAVEVRSSGAPTGTLRCRDSLTALELPAYGPTVVGRVEHRAWLDADKDGRLDFCRLVEADGTRRVCFLSSANREFIELAERGDITIAPQPYFAPQASGTDVALDFFNREIFYDDYGLIVHEDGDGGDTAQREGWYWFGVKLREKLGLPPWPHKRGEKDLDFDQVMGLLEPKGDGVFVRHPDRDPFSADKHEGVTRDQLEPIIAALGLYDRRDTLRRLWNRLPSSPAGKHAFGGKYLLGIDCNKILEFDCSLGCPSSPADGGHCSYRSTPDCPLPSARRPSRRSPLGIGFNALSPSEDTPSDVFLAAGAVVSNPPLFAQGLGGGFAAAQLPLPRLPDPRNPPNPFNPPGPRIPRPNELLDHLRNTLEQKKQWKQCLEKEGIPVFLDLRLDQCRGILETFQESLSFEKVHCEASRPIREEACPKIKEHLHAHCGMAQGHTGDILLPSTVNLYLRALGLNPLTAPSPYDPPVPRLAGYGAAGEVDLQLAVESRLFCAYEDASSTGDDLNLLIRLLMAREPERYPSPLSLAALQRYASRPHSYGSYLGSFVAQYGAETKPTREKMRNGIRFYDWKPEVNAPLGAVRWYHRPDKGANPRLAELWEPILSAVFGNDAGTHERGKYRAENDKHGLCPY